MTSIYSSSSTSKSNSSTNSANLLRISGMASGIDTDSVVKSMVSSYQTKIDKANQAKQILQWKQEAYRDIIKDIKGLQDYFDPLSSKYILGGSSLNINTAASDDTSMVSATAKSSAKAGTYNVRVSQLATQAKVTGSSLDSMVDISNITDWSNLNLTVGTKTITLSGTSSDTSVDKVVASINSQISSDTSLNGKVSASYVKVGDESYIKLTNAGNASVSLTATNAADGTNLASKNSVNSGISSSSLLTSLGFNAKDSTNDGLVSFTLKNGTASSNVSLTVSSSSTIQDLIDQVNSATGGSVTMNIDDTTGAVSFQSKSYGSSSNISIANLSSSNNAIKQLGLSDTLTTVVGEQGKDAIVVIKEPGQTKATTTTQSSNNFTLNGISYNLVGTNDVNDASDSTNITITANSDNVVSNIKKFIEDYNSVISKINTKLTEKRNSDYKPLTDAQKEEMSDDQITAWETKAKVGILRNDDYLSNLMTQVRGIFSSQVYSNYDSKNASTGKVSLSFGQYGTNSIGIDTSTDVTDGGKLILKSETKLKSAIENNFDDFKKLFIGASDSTLSDNQPYVGSGKYMEDGLLKRMDTILRDYVAAPGIGEDGTYTLTGSMNIFVNKQYDFSSTASSGKNTLPDQVYNKTLSISKLKTQMSDAETRYYNKFTALETALNNLSSQQSQLSSMLGTS